MNKRDNIFEHVLYEFNMYLQTFYHWVMIEEEKGNVYKNNVNYESHQIHLRILMEFFENESIKSDDIVVSTVVNSIEGLIINKDDFIEEKKSINKSISHITKTRCKKDYDENVTYIINMYTVIVPLIRKFINTINNNVNDKYKSDLENEQIKNQIKLLKILLLL